MLELQSHGDMGLIRTVMESGTGIITATKFSGDFILDNLNFLMEQNLELNLQI